MRINFIVLLVAVCLLASCTPNPTPAPVPGPSAAPPPLPTTLPAVETRRLPVFITTDMSSDDVVALLYLLKHPSIEVTGIGSSNGVAHVGPAATNVLRLLALLGRSDVPVAIGSDKPLEGDHSFPAGWRGGADGLFGLDVPQATAKPVGESTASLLASSVRSRPGKVVVVLLGAHTDLAMALRLDPSLAAQIKAVHIMGGAVRVAGNINAESRTIPNKVAEWNLWLDYRAAAEVFGSGISLAVVPLDATNLVRVDRTVYERLANGAVVGAAKAVADLWKSQVGSGGASTYVWDAVAAVGLTSPAVAAWEPLSLRIVTDVANEEGRTLVVEGAAPNSQVCTSVEAPAVLEDLLSILRS